MVAKLQGADETRLVGLAEALPGLLPGLSLEEMMTLPWLSLLVRTGRFWIVENKRGCSCWSRDRPAGSVLQHLPWFCWCWWIRQYLSNFQSRVLIAAFLLLQSLEHQEFFLCGPLVVEKGEVQLIDDMVFRVEFLLVAEAGGAEIVRGCQDLGGLADVAFADVALDFVGRVHNILSFLIAT